MLAYKNKITFFFVFAALLFPSLALGANTEDSLDDLMCLGIKIHAVTVDMAVALNNPQQKSVIRDSSNEALQDLENIKQELAKLSRVPEQFGGIKSMLLKVINELKILYSGIENKKQDEIKDALEAVVKIQDDYSSEFRQLLKKEVSAIINPGKINSTAKDIAAITGKEHKFNFVKAMVFMEKGQIPDAYDILAQMYEKGVDESFDAVVMLKLSDCLVRMNEAPKVVLSIDDMNLAIDLLGDVLKKNQYSHLIFETFYKWRDLSQKYRYGQAQTLTIPNKEYNQVRLQQIQVIKAYLASHPDDNWAKLQKDSLIALPNIGHSSNNFIPWQILYAQDK